MPPFNCAVIEARFHDESEGISEVLGWKEALIPEDWGDFWFGVVDHLNDQKQLASIVLPGEKFLPLYFDRWNAASNLQPGELLRIQLLPVVNGKPLVLGYKSIPKEAVPGLLIGVEGSYRKAADRAFGFIEGCRERVFVPPSVAATLKDGQSVSGWALRTKKKDGSLSWNLLPLYNQSQ